MHTFTLACCLHCCKMVIILDNAFFLGHFRVVGRAVHINYLKEQLQSRGVELTAQTQQALPGIIVDIMADSVFLQVRSI